LDIFNFQFVKNSVLEIFSLFEYLVGEIDSLYEAGYTQLPSSHTWHFDWHTEEADRKVEFYLDGQLLRTMRNYFPLYAGRLWLGE